MDRRGGVHRVRPLNLPLNQYSSPGTWFLKESTRCNIVTTQVNTPNFLQIELNENSTFDVTPASLFHIKILHFRICHSLWVKEYHILLLPIPVNMAHTSCLLHSESL